MNDFCEECNFLDVNERDQIDNKQDHICTLFNKRVIHGNNHPNINRLSECKLTKVKERFYNMDNKITYEIFKDIYSIYLKDTNFVGQFTPCLYDLHDKNSLYNNYIKERKVINISNQRFNLLINFFANNLLLESSYKIGQYWNKFKLIFDNEVN